MHKGTVISVSKSSSHSFSKHSCASITLLKGIGVDGDAHAGVTVKHRSRVAQNPHQPNLRQVHLIHQELFHDLQDRYHVEPGELGENITTSGIDLLSLPTDTLLHIGDSAIIQVTGLRNPCQQINDFQSGLMQAVLDHDEQGNLVRKAGIMGIVLEGGTIQIGDRIIAELPSLPHRSLEKV
ncbi:MOSC domain-containing protein [Priestia koreensis]|uniref:MOSC domain-containing protein n=1 Tax=Priestia koreensis TaxID=284581 RepID=UPI0028F732D4|nr:MOSC domain-containing protein [Priestia koreensis]